jgi:hypothetical protein
LATELGISSLVKIKLEYAQLLERHGEYREALSQYESLLKDGLKPEQLYIVKVVCVMHPFCGSSSAEDLYVPDNFPSLISLSAMIIISCIHYTFSFVVEVLPVYS